MKATYFAAAAAVALAGMSGTAHAAFWIDLTDKNAVTPAPSAQGDVVTGGPGLGPSLGGNFDLRGGDVDNDPADVVIGDSVTNLPSGIAGDFDGLGVDGGGSDGDEVDRTEINKFETLTLEFTTETTITGFRFLDLFPDESVKVDGIGLGAFTTSVDADPDSGPGFKEVIGLAWADVNILTFIPGPENDGASDPNFALAGVQVVPLPAAAWLMIGGLGAVGAYARRARKAAPTA